MYIGPGRIGRLPFDGVPGTLTAIVRTEFPDGVDRDFVRRYLVGLLAGPRELPVQKGEQSTAGDLADDAIQRDPKARQELNALLEVPSIIFPGDNSWRVQYLSYAGLGQLSLCVADGTLKPFNIERLCRFSLLTDPIERFDPVALERASRAKEQALRSMATVASQMSAASDTEATPGR